MVSYSCQAPDHKADHADANHCFAVVGANLIVTTKSARLHKPTEGSFNDPALGKNLEAFSVVAAAHDLQSELSERTQLLNPSNQCAKIATIGPDDLHPCIHTHQELDEALGGVAVLRCGRRDHDGQNHSPAVYRHMAFSPQHLFGRVVAAFSGLVAGLDGLAVHNGCGRRDGPPFALAQAVSQRVVDEPPGPILTPLSKVAVDGLPRPKVSGQQPPRTSRAYHIKDGVDQSPTIQGERATTFSFSRFRSRDQRLDFVPFCISQVCWIMSRMRLHPSHL